MKRNRFKTVASILLCLFLLGAFIIGSIPFLGHHIISNFLVRDHSAQWVSQDSFSWQGKVYTMTSGSYREGKTIAKTEDGAFDINEVEGDPDHNFLVARAGIDQALYVWVDYIPITDESKACVDK